MKKKHLFNGWFFTWLGITVILVILMLIVPNWKLPLSATVMALMMTMPVRDWMYRLIVWAIDYVSSINTNFKDKINQYATYNRLISPNTREENVGFYRAIKAIVVFITFILAILWMVFQQTAFYVLYSWLHTLEFLIRGRISWLSLLVYILLTIAFIFFVRWAIGQVANEEMLDNNDNLDWSKAWWRILVMVSGFYIKIILSSLLLKYTFPMFLHSIIFWTTVVGFPIIVLITIEHFRGNNGNGGTP